MKIMMKFKFALLLSLALFACQMERQGPEVTNPPGTPTPAPAPSPTPGPSPPNTPTASAIISRTELETAYGWRKNPYTIPLEKPPQPGDDLKGEPVQVNGVGDLPWSAFTLVLFIDEQGNYEVLTQGRRTNEVETAGGHLKPGKTWAEGALQELEEEAGIKAPLKDLIYLAGGGLKGTPKNPFGNANFVVAFRGKKPQTTAQIEEVDTTYGDGGHKWIPLKTIYQSMIANEKVEGRPYYKYFRSHLLYNFCDHKDQKGVEVKRIIDCENPPKPNPQPQN